MGASGDLPETARAAKGVVGVVLLVAVAGDADAAGSATGRGKAAPRVGK